MIASGTPPKDAGLLAQPGTLAFVVVFALGVVLFFLLRSMTRHLRKVREEERLEEEERFRRERSGSSGEPEDDERASGSAG